MSGDPLTAGRRDDGPVTSPHPPAPGDAAPGLRPGLARVGIALVAGAAIALTGLAVVDVSSVGLWLLWAGVACLIGESLLALAPDTPGTRRAGTAALVAGAALAGLSTMSTQGLGWAPIIAAIVRGVRSDRGWPEVAFVAVAGTGGLSAGALLGGQPGLVPVGILACTVTLSLALLRRNARHSAERERVLLVQQLETERERAENAALAERARLAGDLHDVLAHTLGALTAQLNGAEALLGAGHPHRAKEAVASARQLAAEGLAESRRAVAALREPAGFDASLAELVRVHRESGAAVELERTGTPHRLDPARELAARRIVQELLTNARKHAPGRPVDLEVSWTPAGLTVSATNPLATGSAYAGGLGHGLAAMRERCRGLGGEVRAGRTPDDEFSVTCFLPAEA